MDKIIKNATSIDLEKIARCHQLSFPQSLTSKLGVDFVTNMLKWYLSGPNKFLYWIEENNQCVGFCGGYVMDGSDAYGASSGMTQFGFNSAIKAIIFRPWLIFHPELLSKYKFIWTNVKRKFKNIFKSSEKLTTQTTTLALNKTRPFQAGLVVIGVHPSMHKKGLGSMLIKEFEERTKKMDAKFLSLSVRQQNAQAIKSYERNGWKIAETQGTTSYVMTKTL